MTGVSSALVVDGEVAGPEPGQRQCVGEVGQLEGELEIGVHLADGNDGERFSRTDAMPSPASLPRNVSIS